jgi:hypothetical protein
LLQLADHIRAVHCSLPLLIHDHTILANDVQAAELSQCFLSRGVGRPPRGNETLCPHLEMKRQLVVHLTRDVCASKR